MQKTDPVIFYCMQTDEQFIRASSLYTLQQGMPLVYTYTVNAPKNSAENKDKQKATLNRKALDKPWFSHADLLKGGVLELDMNVAPNKQWGSGVQDVLPSSIDYKPSF